MEKKWELIESALCESAESMLGKTSRRSKVELNPLFERVNQLYKKMLSTGKKCDLKKSCKKARQAAR